MRGKRVKEGLCDRTTFGPCKDGNVTDKGVGSSQYRFIGVSFGGLEEV